MSKFVRPVLDSFLGLRQTGRFQDFYRRLQSSTTSGWPSLAEARTDYKDFTERPIGLLGYSLTVN